ncbi:hypothetical protein Cflav_PD0830 [Pedosphaera parvula Ellin514]|uniref:Uncharacterized protein n=1 Tax=Pedosphaera parvula (strain Ellin514) TaxID=320771 RepID=B9XQR6_PEDPL|nr:hypothetical protein Cflav_PD0830 [Pedosphaera parvula Ellin514]
MDYLGLSGPSGLEPRFTPGFNMAGFQPLRVRAKAEGCGKVDG